MITTEHVKQYIEQYFSDSWVLVLLSTGGWRQTYDIDNYNEITINNIQIRVYRLTTQGKLSSYPQSAVRIAIWNNATNYRDDSYIIDKSQLYELALLLDKFFDNLIINENHYSL